MPETTPAPATPAADDAELYTDPNMNQRLLDDIKQLQDTEKNLLQFLASNNAIADTVKTQIRQRINSLVDMRYRMYQQVGLLNRYYANALDKTDKVLVDQTDAIQVMENTLDRMKKERDSLKDENTNQVRLIQISDYYADRYQANTQLVKILIYTLLPIIFLTFLHNEGLLDNTVFYIMAGLVGMVGAFYFWRKMMDVSQRSNMNFDQYDFKTLKGSGVGSVTYVPTDASSGSATWGGGSCTGAACCSPGQTFDATKKLCVVTPATTTTTTPAPATTPATPAPATGAGGTSAFTLMQPSLLEGAMTRTQANKHKADHVMGHGALLPSNFWNPFGKTKL